MSFTKILLVGATDLGKGEKISGVVFTILSLIYNGKGTRTAEIIKEAVERQKTGR